MGALLLFEPKPGMAVNLAERSTFAAPLSIAFDGWSKDYSGEQQKGETPLNIITADDLFGPPKQRTAGFGAFFKFNAILTGVKIRRQERVQIIYSLSELVYINAFGGRESEIMISGICFAGRCVPGSSRSGPSISFASDTLADALNPKPDSKNANKHGLDLLVEYYEAYRVGARLDPIAMQIGLSPSGTQLGFLTSLDIGTTNPEQQLADFSLGFRAFPVQRKKDTGAGNPKDSKPGGGSGFGPNPGSGLPVDPVTFGGTGASNAVP